MTPTTPAIVWSVGSDSNECLGAFEAFGVQGRAVSPDTLEGTLAADQQPPAAIRAGPLESAADVALLARVVDRLRERHPQLPLVVDVMPRSGRENCSANEQLVDACRRELLPRATVVTANRGASARLLGGAPLTSNPDVERAAQALCDMGCASVCVSGGASHDDYVRTSHARGWLTLERSDAPRHGDAEGVFAAGVAAALALGYVAIEAAVLARMATADGVRRVPTKPQPGFALAAENLPSFWLPGQERRRWSFAPMPRTRIGLYAIVDSADWVERVTAAGVRTVQLRIKSCSPEGLREQIATAVRTARDRGAQLFVNDHWQLAIECGAYGVHLGQEDLAQADLDAIARAGLRLGVSTHSYWEVCRAWALKPSYIACGPIHSTYAKQMPWTPQGHDNLAYWCALLPLPVVAIGGMDATRARQAMECGAAAVAVISAITAAASPERAVAALMYAVNLPSPAAGNPVRALARPTLAADFQLPAAAV